MLTTRFAGRIFLLSAVLCGWAASQARANIYEWTTDAGGNVIQSTTLCPGGSGVSAAPDANLSSLNLTQAYLLSADLAGAGLYSSTLTNANFTNANLASADLYSSTLTNANFAYANVTGADFGNTSLTSAQLYSTASYSTSNLQGIGLI